MRKNFWKKLDKGFTALAPMAGITDSAFRQICAEYGVDVFYSEMASATALAYAPEKTLELLKFSKKERPYVVQLFGSNPKHFEIAVKLLNKKPLNGLKSHLVAPDGIDINFGCPVPKVAKQGAGAELFKDLKKSKEIIKATINNTNLPVSIKTRAKVGNIDVLKFLDYMSDLDIKVLMIHGRTLKQGFKGPIDTEIIKKARNYFKGVIIANGGIRNKEDVDMVLEKTGADGVAIGQGTMGRPWVFESLKTLKGTPTEPGQAENIKINEVFKVALRHTRLAEKLKGKRGVIEMRKHLCWYVQGMEGAREMRGELVKVENIKDVEKIFRASQNNQ